MNTPDEYIAQVAEDKKDAMIQLRKTIQDNIPKDFQECISYKMIGFVVPFSAYPGGYHCDPKLEVPFVSIAAQKNFIALYHMGIYSDENLLNWFVEEYPKHCKSKLDMGKSCIRFKKEIPFELIGQLMQKMSMEQWIANYQKFDPRAKK